MSVMRCGGFYYITLNLVRHHMINIYTTTFNEKGLLMWLFHTFNASAVLVSKFLVLLSYQYTIVNVGLTLWTLTVNPIGANGCIWEWYTSSQTN